VTSSWSGDSELLGALGEALAEARDVPRRFVEAGKAAYTWFTIDAELAALTYDSAGAALGAGVAGAGAPDDLSALPEPEPATRALPQAARPNPAELRSMSFTSTRLKIEIEIAVDALRGQIVPPQRGEIEVQTAGRPQRIAVDELGWFVIRPVPPGAFRLHCQTASGLAVLTPFITL
jgi:hypothetical protein